MVVSGPLAREDFRLASGVHWYAIAIFVVMAPAYKLRDRVSIIYLPLIAVAYYGTHESWFNLFFLGYHGFQIPPGANASWYGEVALSIVISAVLIVMAAFPKTRKLIVRKGSLKLSLALWLGLLGFYIVWMLAGFPVTINVYNLSSYGSTKLNPVANALELAANIIFTAAFYFAFGFGARPKENPKKRILETVSNVRESTSSVMPSDRRVL